MSYSSDALKLRVPDVVELPRLEDRISFLFLDTCRVVQSETGVVAVDDTGARTQIPAAGLSVLLLGPGTSITAPAASTLHRAGTSLLFTDAGGVSAFSLTRPLTNRARFAEAQARLWASETGRVDAARLLYRRRFPDMEWPDGLPLRVMRGMEGQQVKALYRQGARRAKLPGWKRVTDLSVASDPVNPLLNLGNSILYGAALAATSTLGLNPALGFIHQGASGALLFDLADMHKAESSIPLAFELAHRSDGAAVMRRELRKYLVKNRVLKSNLQLLVDVLGPFLEVERGDRLVDEAGSVEGSRNYGS